MIISIDSMDAAVMIAGSYRIVGIFQQQLISACANIYTETCPWFWCRVT
jgi:hypothetical protein